MSSLESMPGVIAVQPTPNPNARKFVLSGKRFAASHNYSEGQAVDDPLAAALLALEGVYNVLMAQDFVTVNKTPQTEWPPLEQAVQAILSEHLARRDV